VKLLAGKKKDVFFFKIILKLYRERSGRGFSLFKKRETPSVSKFSSFWRSSKSPGDTSNKIVYFILYGNHLKKKSN